MGANNLMHVKTAFHTHWCVLLFYFKCTLFYFKGFEFIQHQYESFWKLIYQISSNSSQKLPALPCPNLKCHLTKVKFSSYHKETLDERFWKPHVNMTWSWNTNMEIWTQLTSNFSPLQQLWNSNKNWFHTTVVRKVRGHCQLNAHCVSKTNEILHK